MTTISPTASALQRYDTAAAFQQLFSRTTAPSTNASQMFAYAANPDSSSSDSSQIARERTFFQALNATRSQQNGQTYGKAGILSASHGAILVGCG